MFVWQPDHFIRLAEVSALGWRPYPIIEDEGQLWDVGAGIWSEMEVVQLELVKSCDSHSKDRVDSWVEARFSLDDWVGDLDCQDSFVVEFWWAGLLCLIAVQALLGGLNLELGPKYLASHLFLLIKSQQFCLTHVLVSYEWTAGYSFCFHAWIFKDKSLESRGLTPEFDQLRLYFPFFVLNEIVCGVHTTENSCCFHWLV